MDELLILLSRVILAFRLITVIVGFRYRKDFVLPIRIFWLFIIVSFFIAFAIQAFVWLASYHFDWIKPFVMAVGIKSTNTFQILYHVADLCFLGYFYSIVMQDFKWIKGLAFVLAGVCLINYLFFEGPHVYGILNPNLDAIFSFCMPLMYMWQIFNRPNLVHINKNPFFWFSLGLIVNNLLSLFMFFVADKLFKTDFVLYTKTLYISNLSIVISFILYCLGFYYGRFAKYIQK